jgi:hypothetical protein
MINLFKYIGVAVDAILDWGYEDGGGTPLPPGGDALLANATDILLINATDQVLI